MDMPDSGRQTDQYRCKGLRRLDLASRMLRLQARTRTICDWTGLSRTRVQSLSRAYSLERGERPADRLRGPSPSTLTPFWESRRLRREAALLAGLCRLCGVVGGVTGAWRLPSLQRGERLCLAYETYLSVIARPRVSLEHAVLLIRALAMGEEIALDCCSQCRAVTLVDRLGGVGGHCTYCLP
jgi:hypothetical protein